jgi:hypothetical protein
VVEQVPDSPPGRVTHRHDFEEMFTVFSGEIEAMFRGKKVVVQAGQTINVPSNAPPPFTDALDKPARLLCMCSPPGTGGVLPGRRRSRREPDDTAAQAQQGRTGGAQKKAEALAPRYRTELLKL